MKKLLLFVFVAFALAGCEQAPIDETQGVTTESNRSLEVSFEGADETRIQLQDDKSVWTKGDLVSVFYRSTTNEKWQFMGETGDRTGQIVPVDNSVNPPATQNSVVVVYPYNEDYFFNTDTYNVEASLPAVQTYLKDSYGMNGNIMISSSEFNKVSLKSVCGWLKLQLTGNGEVVKSITLRGNNGEQVAGLIYVNSADATATLASTEKEVGDNEVGGTLVRPDAILTDVTLDCSEGVTLGAEATAFYIALPPQTFAKGLTVEITDDSGYTMTQATDKVVAIERNTIQPMAAIEFINPNPPTQPTPASNEIWYTSSDGDVVTPYNTNFGAKIISNTYNNGKGIITFDGNVTMVGYQAFYNCDNFITINLPDSVKTIGNYAFCGCDSLTSVNIPESVTTIGDYAFYSCYNLTSVNIPDSVTMIGNYAFRDCYSLTSVTIGNSVTTIGNDAFDSCDSLTSVNIPDSVKTIGEAAFYSCDSLTSVTIGNSVTTIGNAAFSYCYSLTSVNIPDSVTTIGQGAFCWCTNLTSVNIPESVTTIGNSAFEFCKSLTSVNIPESVTTIGNHAFSACYSLTSVNIPDSVTIIGDWAFQDCYSLTSVNIGDSVTTIGDWAFSHCSNLREFTGKYAADGGRCLIIDNTIIAYAQASGTTYNIPESVTTIGNSAFYYCTSLTSVSIPDSVTTIGNAAFCGCTSLTSVNIPESVTTIGNDAFACCESLTSANIPDSVTTIGNSAFEYCTSLTSVNIPDSVTTIGDYAFRICSSLTSVTIPDSVTTIGNEAFYDCKNLKYVYCKATTPPALGGSNVFDYNPSGRRIIVPIGSGEAYKTAEYWSEYAYDIFEDEF